MSNTEIKELLVRLHNELENTKEIDTDTIELVRTLSDDISNFVDTNEHSHESKTLMTRAGSLETEFAAKHPVAERVLREIIDTLAKMGI